MSDSESLIIASHVAHHFGQRQAVVDLSFKLQPGMILGLLGPNGCGKTTTVRMLIGNLNCHAGELRVLGLNPFAHGPAVRQYLGIVPQEDALDPELNMEQNLSVYGRYFGFHGNDLRQKVDVALDMAGLRDRRRAPIQDLSGGMRRRLVLARALLNSPQILILDEPTTALDPQARRLVWRQILDLAHRKKLGVILTSHFMDEAEFLCDEVIFISHGRSFLQGSPADLIERECSREVVEYRGDPILLDFIELTVGSYLTASSPIDDPRLVRLEPERLLLMSDNAQQVIETVNQAVSQSPCDEKARLSLSVLRRRSSLDDVYIKFSDRTCLAQS